MNNYTYGYVRVSTKEQNLDRQLLAIKKYIPDEKNIITDKESGENLDRQGYQILRNMILRSGDTLIIKSLDRLSRNKSDIKRELEFFREKKIRLKVIDLPTTMIDLEVGQEWVFNMVNNILIEVLGTIAEQERMNIKLRQAEGIAAAHARGVKFGRPRAKLPENWDSVIQDWKAGNITAVRAMQLTNTKRTTFYKLVKLNYTN